jgi:hypothetical protein
VVAKVRERLAKTKQKKRRVPMDRFNLKKLPEEEGNEQFLVEISNNFASLENLDTKGNINRSWETIRKKEYKNFSQRECGLL